jgi:hypothetical protein
MNLTFKDFSVQPIKPSEAVPWIFGKHYSKRMPTVSYAFGLYEQTELRGIVTYGIPASPFLCIGVCGVENKEMVLELNRLCITDNIQNGASFLVSRSLKMLPSPAVVVSYADTAMNHVGYIYQATNFLFTGTTKERTDMSAGDGKHSRHNKGNRDERVSRSAKHRYVFFVGSKKQKSQLLQDLRYSIKPYPKGKSEKYDAGGDVQTQPLLFCE